MSNFCAICGGHHDPGVGCTDRVGSVLREAGLKRRPTGRKSVEKKVKEADRFMLMIALGFFLLIILTIVLTLLVSKPHF